MIDFKEAIQTILTNVEVLGTEKVPLKSAHNRVLAADTFYDVALPPFNKSAMDGYACKMSDIAKELDILEVVHAGKKPEHEIGENQCAKIMTGAVVPEGADCVVMREYAEEKENRVSFTIDKTKSNICYTGEDVKVGDLALPKNTLLNSRHMPILAGAGITNPEVKCQPRVSVFATGSELVEPSEQPLPFQIRNTNSSQMMAQIEEIGITGKYGGIITDDFEETKQKIAYAFEKSDVVILSGGVSEGDFDFIPSVIEALGFETLISRISVQPGKPLIFAKNKNKYCFGLAGNPASSYVQFELYIKPFLYQLMGYELEPTIVKAKISAEYIRKKTDRLKFIPAFLKEDLTVMPVEYHGAAHINALVHANALIQMPIGVSKFSEGEIVDVRRI
ncbi:molybdopterin molybdotransferase MoeA [Labilibacter marinus]|uniref:molybdopterin molybdotransferase MoeA n=1 Tax=Labilibacter marinus TaxID=1477105 RepID=UPI00094F61A9|nr:gephyrin-like molybdotransferase Glp [Labilibacter marinus]